ncbi:MAG: hypothetical protein Q9191_003676 [Dirinaria sp. TL-2023a]
MYGIFEKSQMLRRSLATYVTSQQQAHPAHPIKDYFFICPGHVKDRNFATPIIDEADATAKKKREELDREVELVKKEYEEKLKKKQEVRDTKKQEAEKGQAGKDKVKSEHEETDAMLDKEKDEKINAITSKQTTAAADDGPRIFALQK